MTDAITLKKEKIYTGPLLLVNLDCPLRVEDESNLICADMSFPNVKMKREVVNVLLMIFEKIGCGNKIVPVSGYRTAKEQLQIYENSLKESGEEFTRKYVALPYRSEHQTGLAIDLGLNQEQIDFIRPNFPYEGICQEFRKAAPEYGFIQRYPKGKEKITGIAHEPWHFRYVGYPHSEIMTKKGLTLEEYMEFIKGYSYEKEHLFTNKYGKTMEIFYAASREEDITLHLPRKTVYQISGNNRDGFIITLWRNDYE